MIQDKASVAAFLRRLADIAEGDESDQDVFIGSDTDSVLRTDGTVGTVATGAEAIMIVRGPAEGREPAVRQLLARVTH